MKKIISALIVITLFLISCAQKNDKLDKPVACTADAKLCPDGSSVGRVGPNCDFQKCPENNNQPVGCTKEAKLCPDGSSVGRVGPNCDFQKCPEDGNTPKENKSEMEKHYCNPGDKNGEVCFELYAPVCGWLNPAKIQCIRYPCARTFSNSCFACMDKDVIYWTDEECPAN